MERLEFDMLFRWFVGLELDERVWDARTFTKNRDRVLDEAVARSFFEAVLERARRQRLLSRDHFTVDGTLIEAWASHKSFRRKGGGDDEGGSLFCGKKRKNDTHESTTDPESLAGNHRVTVGAEKPYDNMSLVEGARALRATPHMIQSQKGRRSRIDGRTVRHPGYTASVRRRSAVEGSIGWMKQYGLLRRPMLRGCRQMNMRDALERCFLQYLPNPSLGGCGMSQPRVDAAPWWLNRGTDHASIRVPYLNPPVGYAVPATSHDSEERPAPVRPQP